VADPLIKLINSGQVTRRRYGRQVNSNVGLETGWHYPARIRAITQDYTESAAGTRVLLYVKYTIINAPASWALQTEGCSFMSVSRLFTAMENHRCGYFQHSRVSTHPDYVATYDILTLEILMLRESSTKCRVVVPINFQKNKTIVHEIEIYLLGEKMEYSVTMQYLYLYFCIALIAIKIESIN